MGKVECMGGSFRFALKTVKACPFADVTLENIFEAMATTKQEYQAARNCASFPPMQMWIPPALDLNRRNSVRTWFLLWIAQVLTLTRPAVTSELYRVAAKSLMPNPPNHLVRARAIWAKVSIGRRKAATVAAAALAL